MIEVVVSRLGMDPGTQTYVVVLQEKGGAYAFLACCLYWLQPYELPRQPSDGLGLVSLILLLTVRGLVGAAKSLNRFLVRVDENP